MARRDARSTARCCEKEKARAGLQEEREAGKDAGLASKNGYQTFDFAVSRIPAGGEARMRFVYYQPLEIDTGVGRYLYPLEEGGTDDQAARFWLRERARGGHARRSTSS